MSDIVPVSAFDPNNRDFSEIHFTQSKTGHVHSPWLTFDYKESLRSSRPFYGFNNHTAHVMRASASAFAEALGIDARDTILTQREEPSEIFGFYWRVSSAMPCKLPERKAKESKKVSLAQNGDIEIDATVVPLRIK
jgi:hypothetical protein